MKKLIIYLIFSLFPSCLLGNEKQFPTIWLTDIVTIDTSVQMVLQLHNDGKEPLTISTMTIQEYIDNSEFKSVDGKSFPNYSLSPSKMDPKLLPVITMPPNTSIYLVMYPPASSILTEPNINEVIFLSSENIKTNSKFVLKRKDGGKTEISQQKK